MKYCLQCGTVATNNEAKCETCEFTHFTEPTKGLEEIMAENAAIIAAQAARIAALEAALAPFAADDLCEFLGGNCNGAESVVFGRKNTELKIKHFRAARELLKGE